jgi:hypothetical protein
LAGQAGAGGVRLRGRRPGIECTCLVLRKTRDGDTPAVYGVQALPAALRAPICYLGLNQAGKSTKTMP